MNPVKNKYRYTITNRLGVFDAQPLGESDFKIDWERQDETKLSYSKDMPSRLKLRGDVYDNLLRLEQSIYRCDYINISIERACTAYGGLVWMPWFSGRFSLNDGDWNLDKCEVELELQEVKLEQCIEDRKSDTIDLFQLVSARRTVLVNPPNVVIERVTFFQSAPAPTGTPGIGDCGSGGPYWDPAGGKGPTPEVGHWVDYYHRWQLNTAAAPGEANACIRQTRWAREVITIGCLDPAPGPDWGLIEDTCPLGNKKYARPVSVYGCVNTESELDEEIQIRIRDCKIIGDTATGNQEIDNGMLMKDCLSEILELFCPGLSVVSDFFQINPEVPSATNYVTGQRSKVANIIVNQKSDVKRPGVTANATKAETTFDKFLTALCEIFNCRWRIEGSVFRIEHISYFSKNTGIITTVGDKYKRFIQGSRRYTYENESIPSREEFTLKEAGNADFVGMPITYSGACVSKSSKDNVKTHAVEDVTTDVEFCFANSTTESSVVDDEGLVFIACETNGTDYWIITEPGIIDIPRLNNSLAWAQLHRDYHRYYRPLRSGNMNGEETVFFSVKPTKKGQRITIPLCCDDSFNPDDYVSTPLGLGTVSKATFSFKDESLELELLYPADEGLSPNNPPVANNDVVSVYEGSFVIFNPTLNDTDPQGDNTISKIEIVTPPMHGVATVDSAKTIKYESLIGYLGDDYLTYRVYDNWNEPSNVGLIAVTILP